jgi:branched-chain amino acid transport system permease protein
VTGVACGLVALPSLFTDPRTRGVFLVPITTLATAEVFMAYVSANNEFAGGFAGLVGVPQPFLKESFRLGASGFLLVYAGLALLAAIVATLLVVLFQHSAYGRRLRATRDDELEVRALGYSTVGHQFFAFVLGGALMGGAGVLWAAYLGSLQPTSFTITETLLVLIAVIVGGRGRVPGVMLGAVLVFGVLNQLTRQLPSEFMTSFPGARQVIIGGVLIVILLTRPQGVLPERFRQYSKPTRTTSVRSPSQVGVQ